MDEGRRLETVQTLFERGDQGRLLDFLNAAHPPDIAQTLRDLRLERRSPPRIALLRLPGSSPHC